MNEENKEMPINNVNVGEPNNINEPNLQLKENIKIAREKNSIKYMVIGIIAVVIILLVLIFTGALSSKEAKAKKKAIYVNELATNIWNDCMDQIYWYIVDGTGVNGSSINIDNVIAKCDIVYDNYKKEKEAVEALDNDEFASFKEYYQKIAEQVEIIYSKVKAEKPTAKGGATYEDNMEILYEWQLKLYEFVNEKYAD